MGTPQNTAACYLRGGPAAGQRSSLAGPTVSGDCLLNPRPRESSGLCWVALVCLTSAPGSQTPALSVHTVTELSITDSIRETKHAR